MKRPFLSRLSWLLACAAILALLFHPTITSHALPGDLAAVEAAWARARAAGVYRFTANIVQTTLPLPSVTNVGRASHTDSLYVEGETDLPARQLSMRLWSQGGSALSAETAAETAAELRIEDGHALGRQGAEEWQELGAGESTLGGMFAAGGDLLAFLAAAKNVERVTASEEGADPSLYTRYAFDVDGRSYALYVRDQLQQALAEKGALPAGVSLDLPRQYVDMRGAGELWIGPDGYPARQIIHLEFSPRSDGQQVVADITINLYGFGRSDSDERQGVSFEGARGLFGDHPERVLSQLGSGLFTLIFLGVVVLHRRSRLVYTGMVALLVASMLSTPLLQSVQAAHFAEQYGAVGNRAPGSAGQEAADGDVVAADWDVGTRARAQLAPESARRTLPSLPLSTSYDTDADGLTDSQEQLLGTNPENADTDGDTLSDGFEAQGFSYNGQDWYLDPRSIDTNGDGIDDRRECPDGVPCPDADSDGAPDTFDRDNDGDDVPDHLDISPFSKSSASFSDQSPLSFVVNSLTPGKPTYVEFQLRPADAGHLWYAMNVLDWPRGDEAGQMQDVDGKTFYQLDNDQPRSPNDNGDIKLVPMLEIRIAGSPDNLPTQEELEPYGIFVQKMSEDGARQAIYTPLYLIVDDTGGDRVAFAGKMLYAPAGAWGDAQEVRLAWVIQALVDVCTRYKDGECAEYATNQPQVIHTYYDDWFLTGLAVTENHGVEIALIYEDPAQDGALAGTGGLRDDAALFALADGLDYSFLTGRDDDQDGQRDITLDEIYHRFDRLANAADPDAQRRWNIPNVLRVVRHSYEHADLYLQHIATDTREILDGVFTAHWSETAPTTPTLMTVREERVRANNLDAQNEGNTIAWDGARLSVELPQSGQDGLPVQSIAGLNWVPFRYDGLDWTTSLIDEYWEELPARYPFAGKSDAQTRAGFQLGTQLYYLSLYAGAMRIVQVGDELPQQENTRSDPALAAKYAAALANAAGQTRPGEAIVEAIFDSLRDANPGAMQDFWRDLGELAQAAGLANGARLKSPSSWPVHLAAQFKWLEWGGVGGAALSGAVAGLAQTINGRAFEQSSWSAYDYGYERDVETPYIAIPKAILKGGVAVYSTYSAIKDLYGLYKLSTWLGKGAMARWGNIVGKFGKGVAVAVFLFDLFMAWSTFVTLTNDMAAFSPQFNMLVARAIAATILAIVFFALNLTFIGCLVTALFALVDSIVELTTGFSLKLWIIDQMARALYTYEVTVDVDKVDTAPLSPSLEDPYAGFAEGNVLVASTRVTSTISSANPQNWRLKLYRPAFYTESKLKRTTLEYTLTPDEQALNVGRDEMRPAWDVTKEGYCNYQGVAHTGNLETRSMLEAGINRSVLYLNTGYALPAAECWTIWIYIVVIFVPVPIPIPVCYDRTFSDHTSTDMDFKLDVFPASLDEFYRLTPAGNGGYRLAWDSRFPPLMDADGDGLLSGAHNGPDPDDDNPDIDGDGLPDQKEMRLREVGIPVDPRNPDSDGDGLSDYEEIHTGSDPTKADTDNDGLPDSVETRGWSFDAEGLATRVASSPLRRDSDGDGINDMAEYTLGAPYHPMVWNESPIGLYTETSDEDNYVYPGQTFQYTATVRNNFDQPLYTHGDMVADAPEALGVSRNMAVNGVVYAIAASQDGAYIYVGGQFDQAGGVSAANVARWDRATASWSALGSGVDGAVRAIAVHEDEVYVGGSFSTAGGASANRIAMWDRTTQTWSALGSGLSSSDYAVVYAIAASGDEVYVGGHFTQAGGLTANHVARWSRSAASWAALGGGVGGWGDDSVYALATGEDELYVGGRFLTAGGMSAPRVARWERATQTWATLGGGVGERSADSVIAIAVWGNNIYVGGNFTQAGGQSANYIARWDRDNRTWSTLGSGLNNPVRALAVNTVGDVYAGGNFSQAAGGSANRVARWTGAAWDALGSGVDNVVNAVIASGSQIVFGGDFSQAGGRPAAHLAAWNDLLESWAWPDQLFFTLFRGEEAAITRTLTVDPAAFTQPAPITSAQRSQFNDTGYAGAWDWDARRESSLALDSGQRAWRTAIAPFPVQTGEGQGEGSYLVAALVGDAPPAAAALRFDGSGDYVTTTRPITLTGGSFTVEFWARRESPGSPDMVIGQGTVAANSRRLHIGFRDSNAFTCAFYGNDLNTPAYTDTDWHHWACTYDAGVNRRIIYRDGVQVAQDTAASDYQGTGILYIGRLPWSTSDFFGGLVDEVRIWSVARTQEQVRTNMERRPAGDEVELLAYWPFDEGAGNVIHDRTANGNDGALQNDPSWDAGAPLLDSVEDGRIAIYTAGENGLAAAPIYVDDGAHAKSAVPPTLACNDEAHCLAAWTEERGGQYDVYGAVISSNLSAGDPFLVAGDAANCARVTLQTLRCDSESDGEGTMSEIYITLADQQVWYNGGIDDGNTYTIGAAAGFCRQATLEVWEKDDNSGDDMLASWTLDAQAQGLAVQPIAPIGHFAGALTYTVAAGHTDELRPSVASDGDGFLLSWERRPPDEGAQIWVRPVSAAGVAGAELRLDDRRAWDAGLDDVRPDLIWAGEHYLAAWEFHHSPTDSDVWMASVDDQGGYVTDSAQRVATNSAANERQPSLAYNPDLEQALAAYLYNDDEVRGKLVQGHNLSNEFAAGSQAANSTLDAPRVAYDPLHSSWLAAWNELRSDGRPAVSFQALRGDEPGPALHFDGGDDYVDVGQSIDLANASFTVEFWARRDKTGNFHVIVGHGTNAANRGLHLGFRENNTFTCGFFNNDLNTPAYTGTDWCHWACTYDATSNTRTIYRDGLPVAQDSSPADYQGVGNLNIGRAPWGYYYLAGIADEVRVWNVVRTQKQLEAGMHRRLTGAEAGLVGYWRLDENSGGAAYDQTANHHDGALVNGPAWTTSHAPYRSSIQTTGPRQQYTWQSELAGESALACPPPSGPRALWLRFEEPVGAASFADDSGNGNAGACQSSACPDAGVVGHVGAALRFDGSDDWIESADMDIGDDFTLSLWIKPNNTQDGQAFIARHTDSGGNLVIFGFYHGGYEFNLRGHTYWAGVKTSDWQHLAVVGRKAVTNTEVSVYKNGQLLWRRTLDVVVGDLSGKGWSIGQEWDGGSTSDFFGGVIDEVIIFNRALSAGQIQNLYAGSSAPCALATNTAPEFAPGQLYYNRLGLLWPARWMGVVESPEPLVEPVFIDADPPLSSSVTSLYDGQYIAEAAVLVIGGEAYDRDSGIQKVEIEIAAPGGGGAGDWQPAHGAEAWAYVWAMPVDEGPYALRTRAADNVGHVFTAGAPTTVILDSTAPTLTCGIQNYPIITPTRDAQGRWIVPLYGGVQDPPAGSRPGSGVAAVEVLLEGQSAGVAGNGWQTATVSGDRWSINYVLPLVSDEKNVVTDPTGDYRFSIRAADRVGNRTSSGRYLREFLRIDAQAPVAEITYTGPSTTTITQTLALRGVLTDPGEIAKGLSGLEIAFVPADVEPDWGNWQARYYSGVVNFAGVVTPVLARTDPAIDFDWGDGSPHPAIPPAAFSARWEQMTVFKAAGVYRFEARHDNGVRVYLDGGLLLDAWADQRDTTHAATAYVAGGAHTLRVEYYHRSPLDAGGIPVAQPAIIRFAAQLVEIDPGWMAVALDHSGPGVTHTTWAYTTPGGLEGIYRIALRGWDVFDNRAGPSTWDHWQGEIDTLAPRVNIQAQGVGGFESARTEIGCWAEDLNLIEGSFECPCPGQAQPTPYDSAWWRTWVSDTTRLYRMENSCILPGWQPSTPYTVRARDVHGRESHMTTIGMQRNIRGVAANEPEAFIFTPTHWSVLTATTPISIAGAALSDNADVRRLQTLTLTVDDVVIYTYDWPVADMEDDWATTWPVPGEGPHRLLAVASDARGSVTTVEQQHPITVVVDTLPPAIRVPSAVLTMAHRLSYARVVLTGLYTETGWVDAIRVRSSAAGESPGRWFNAAPAGDGSPVGAGKTWRYAWYLNENDEQRPEPDGEVYTVTAEITDAAGRTAQHTNTVSVDLIPPAEITVTLAYTHAGGQRAALSVGQTIRDVPSPTLIIEWTASSDGGGLAGYLAGWTTSETPDPTQLTAYAPGANRRHEQQVGDVQRLFAHVAAQDNHGNRQWRTLGPIYVDGPLTPDYIAFPYHGWMESGCSQIGADREMARHAHTMQALTGAQRLYATWDNSALRLAWSGANWGDPAGTGNGDLFIYLDTQPGGARLAYNPYTATPPGTIITLPAPVDGEDELVADYLVWVKDAAAAALMAWDAVSETWVFADPPLPAGHYNLDTTLEPPVTDLYLPFDMIGIGHPATASLKLAALASEEGDLRLWAAIPDKNPLNSRWTGAGLLSVASYTLTQQHTWPSLGAGLCPNQGLFTDADLDVDLTATPPGLELGYLEHKLLYLTPGQPLDADLDGEPDVALPVDATPTLVGPGQVLTYTLRYINRGPQIAPGVRITVTARGALALSEHPLLLELGDVSPGDAITTFTGQVDTSIYTRSIEVIAVVADAVHGAFEWLWVQHDVDRVAPEELSISRPRVYIRPYTNTVRGAVVDPSGVPTLLLEARLLPGGAPFTTPCADATPDDGRWTCAWNAGNAQNGAQFRLRAHAWDRYGNGPAVSEWVTLTVDSLAPTITLDAGSEARLQSVVLGPGDTLLVSGQVLDEHLAAGAEVCFDQAYGRECKYVAAQPGTSATGDWSYSLRAVSNMDNAAQTFYLYGVDGAGNRSTTSLVRNYQVDTVPPVITVTTYVNYLPDAVPTLVLAGAASDGSAVSEMYVSVKTPAGNAAWDPITLSENQWGYTLHPQTAGAYVLQIEARDPHGNARQAGPFKVVVVEEAVADLAASNDGPTTLGRATTLSATVTAGTNVNYTWSFGDGQTGQGARVSHVYAAAGVYTAVVTASNSVNSLSAATNVLVTPRHYDIYLPVVLKNG